MSSSGGKSSEQFSFAAPGGPMSQSSVGSLTGASSADATVMTMRTGSQVSGQGRVAPPETIATGSDARTGNAKRTLKRFTRSTSPRTNMDRSYLREALRELRSRTRKVSKREKFNSFRCHDQPAFRTSICKMNTVVYMLDTRVSILNRKRNFRS